MSLLRRIVKKRSVKNFINSIKDQRIKILDVGCGNKSSIWIKKIKPYSTLTGIDVVDFNQNDQSMKTYDDYILASP